MVHIDHAGSTPDTVHPGSVRCDRPAVNSDTAGLLAGYGCGLPGGFSPWLDGLLPRWVWLVPCVG
jgi:hypothetical protein